MAERKSLGRGLEALLSDNYNNDAKPSKDNDETGAAQIPVDNIIRNENQPRKVFEESAMLELVNSIRTHGVITPIIVVKRGERYMIIAGERRWRAAKRAGLRTIPAIVRDYTERQVKEISLIENLQREDLNPIETAKALKQLMDDYSYTQEQAADRIGKSRSAVANMIGLLTLDERVMALVEGDRLSPGHAKVLISVSDRNMQYALALKGADGNLSVRAFETLVRSTKEKPEKSENKAALSLELSRLVEDMQRAFATKVSVMGNDKKGRIYIDYFSRDDLDRIAELLKTMTAN